MPEDNEFIAEDMGDKLGYHALYEKCEDSELSEGVILVAVVRGIIYIFQLNETTDILNEESVPIMEGTLFEYLEDTPCDEGIDYFPISNCRFPTREEFDWYNKMETV